MRRAGGERGHRAFGQQLAACAGARARLPASGGVFALVLSLDSRVPTPLALGLLLPDYGDWDREYEYTNRWRRRWVRTGGDGEKQREQERGKGKQ